MHMSVNAKLFDVVKLITGQKGTIVDVSRNGDKVAFAIEIDPLDPDVELVYVTPDQVQEVIWSSPN